MLYYVNSSQDVVEFEPSYLDNHSREWVTAKGLRYPVEYVRDTRREANVLCQRDIDSELTHSRQRIKHFNQRIREMKVKQAALVS